MELKDDDLVALGKKFIHKIECLKCPICLDIIEDARRLPCCKHVFCCNCWETYKTDKEPVTCPVCKEEVPKRKFLKRDAAFNSICIFAKKLCMDFKEHKKIDIFSYFTCPKSSKTDVAPKTHRHILESFEEIDIIPCTARTVKNKKLPKKTCTSVKKHTVGSKIKAGQKPGKLEIKKNAAIPNKEKKSEVAMKNCSSHVKKLLNSKKQPVDECSKKSRILQWLNDTRNKFERLSQTQNTFSQKNTFEDIDLPSVSQVVSGKTIKKQDEACTCVDGKMRLPKARRARSVENLKKTSSRRLKRHSIESSSPCKSKEYLNLDHVKSIEKQLIVDIIQRKEEDMVGKESIATKNQKLPSKSELFYNLEVINLIENQFLSQLDNEMSKDSEKSKKENICPDKLESKTDKDKKIKSSWKSISKFKKTIGKSKAPKKLNISLQSTQKQNKRDHDSEVTTNNIHDMSKCSSDLKTKDKTIDFQKMEEYFSKAIPELIKENKDILNDTSSEINVKTISQCVVKDKSPIMQEPVKEKQSFVDDVNSDSGSDIYVHNTQPLHQKSQTQTSLKIERAKAAAIELKKIIISLMNFSHKKSEEHNVAGLFPIIQSIFDAMTLLKNNGKNQNLSVEMGEKIFTRCSSNFSDKNIQTDVFSLDGFNITPTAAFKSLSYENVSTQTDGYHITCTQCGEQKFNSSKIILGNETQPEHSKSINPSLHFVERTIELIKDAATLSLLQENINRDPSEENLVTENSGSLSKTNAKYPGSLMSQSGMLIEDILQECCTKLDSYLSPKDKNVFSIKRNSQILVECENKLLAKADEKRDLNVNSNHNSSKHSSNNSSLVSIEHKNNSEVEKEKKLDTPSVSKQKNVFYDSQLSGEFDKNIDTKLNENSDKHTCEEELNCEISAAIKSVGMKNNRKPVSQGSDMLYTLPSLKTKVDRKHLFQKALSDRMELENTLKRTRTINSEDDEERPSKVPCNNFMQNDLSIEFETETLREDVETQKDDHTNNQVNTKEVSNLVSRKGSEGPSTKTLESKDLSHSVSLHTYCDRLIEKANAKIFSKEKSPIEEKFCQLPNNSSKIEEKISSNKIVTKPITQKDNQQEDNATETQDLMLKHCELLIAKANRQIGIGSSKVNNDRNPGNVSSQIPTKSQKLPVIEDNKESSEKTSTIKSQDLLDHCNALIEKTTKALGRESTIINSQRNCLDVRFGLSQVAKSSMMPDETKGDLDRNNTVRTQDLLDHCNALIEKTTRDINKSQKHHEKPKITSQIVDDFLTENLDQLDSVIENATNRQSQCDHNASEITVPNNALDETIRCSTPKRKNLDVDSLRKKIKIFQNVKLKVGIESGNSKNDFNSSDDEIFSDVDIVETTPQKLKNSLERFNFSQAMKQNSPMKTSEAMLLIDIVPPPPGFGDPDQQPDCNNVAKNSTQKESENVIPTSLSPGKLKTTQSKIASQNMATDKETEDILPHPLSPDQMKFGESQIVSQILRSAPTQRESENIIPNSLSPERLRFVSYKKKPLSCSNLNSKKEEDITEAKILSQEFMKMSPISKDSTRNVAVIDMVRQSKFSPLMILPRASPSLTSLTSTPKQKSILNYVRSKNTSQSEHTKKVVSQSQKSKPCIAFSRLQADEISIIQSLCHKNLASSQSKFSSEITHMIVSVDKHNKVLDHTIKFIYAVASGLWILNINWVKECVEQNCIVDEEPYEVSDFSGIPGPRISRLTRLTNPLFQGFKFFLSGPFSLTDIHDVKIIIQLLSGIVVASIEEFRDRGAFTCLVLSDDTNSESVMKYEDWLMEYKVLTVDINWFITSVARYRILSVKSHLLCPEDSLEGLGYPSHMLLDVAATLTQNATCD